MPALLVALMVVVILLFALGAFVFLAKVMKAEAERVRSTRPVTTGNH